MQVPGDGPRTGRNSIDGQGSVTKALTRQSALVGEGSADAWPMLGRDLHARALRRVQREQFAHLGALLASRLLGNRAHR
jgi:hypothetical protein